MISEKENIKLTRVDADMPVGHVLRQYWQPAALTEEVTESRPIVPVTLLGERLALFRREDGGYGLIGRHCLHRGADLCYGRLEDGGVRCPFHGWLFDAEGRCLEQPAEPEGSRFHERLKHKAYPCLERNGIIFAYLGEGAPPPLPGFDCFAAPRSHVFAFKGWWECNWLQALEVGIDPAHASFLHRFFADESPEESYGKQFRAGAAGTNVPLTQILRDYDRPTIEIEDQDYGFRLRTIRALNDGQVHYRITNLVFPNAIAIPMSHEMTITQWHVPIDNENCYWYAMFTSFTEPVNRELMREQRLQEHSLPDYRPRKNKSNHYGFDLQEQRTQTYTGMGFDINVHDQWAVESLGAIQDRRHEHLGQSDIGIKQYRRLLKQAIDAASPDAMPCRPSQQDIAAGWRGPIAIDALGSADQPDCWRQLDLQRRDNTCWGAKAP